MNGTAYEAWWLPTIVAYRYVGTHPTKGTAYFATLAEASAWAASA